MSVDTQCKCGTYFPTGNGNAKMCSPCYIKRVAELEAALRLAQDAMTAIKFSIDPNDITDDLTAVFDLGNRAVNAAIDPK